MIEMQTAGDLRELVESLAKQRALADAQRLSIKEAEEGLHATPQWALVQERRALLNGTDLARNEIEGLVRALALQVARETSDKNPVPGIKVVKQILFVVTDNQKAAEWARMNAPLALRVDEQILAKLVTSLPVDRRQGLDAYGIEVSETEYGSVRIDRDLAPHYLVPKE